MEEQVQWRHPWRVRIVRAICDMYVCVCGYLFFYLLRSYQLILTMKINYSQTYTLENTPQSIKAARNRAAANTRIHVRISCHYNRSAATRNTYVCTKNDDPMEKLKSNFVYIARFLKKLEYNRKIGWYRLRDPLVVINGIEHWKRAITSIIN